MKRVFVDVSLVPLENRADFIVKRLRVLGLDRGLYGSDSPPLAAWKAFRKLPLTEGEFRRIEKKHRAVFEVTRVAQRLCGDANNLPMLHSIDRD